MPRSMAVLDKYFPPRGPCAFCGHHDARHRLWDAMIERHDAGESTTFIAEDYKYPPRAILAVLRTRPYHRRKHAS